jgi:hypothetical protein
MVSYSLLCVFTIGCTLPNRDLFDSFTMLALTENKEVSYVTYTILPLLSVKELLGVYIYCNRVSRVLYTLCCLSNAFCFR